MIRPGLPIRGCLLVLMTCAVLGGGGCVRRRMTIHTNPPGALVYVDDQEIGTTPVSANFTYYGTRKIHIIKDGYETVTELHRFSAPWYQVPPLDFVSENLWPREIRDERVLNFQLMPQRVVPTEELLGRARQLRDGARTDFIVPLEAGGNPFGAGMPSNQTLPSFPPQGTLPPPAGAQPYGYPPNSPPQNFPPPPVGQPAWQNLPPGGVPQYAPPQ